MCVYCVFNCKFQFTLRTVHHEINTAQRTLEIPAKKKRVLIGLHTHVSVLSTVTFLHGGSLEITSKVKNIKQNLKITISHKTQEDNC